MIWGAQCIFKWTYLNQLYSTTRAFKSWCYKLILSLTNASKLGVILELLCYGITIRFVVFVPVRSWEKRQSGLNRFFGSLSVKMRRIGSRNRRRLSSSQSGWKRPRACFFKKNMFWFQKRAFLCYNILDYFHKKICQTIGRFEINSSEKSFKWWTKIYMNPLENLFDCNDKI